MAETTTPPTTATREPWVDLTAMRTAHGWTKTDLARAADVSLPYLSLLESGQRTNPREPIVKRLADALDVTVQRLNAGRPA